MPCDMYGVTDSCFEEYVSVHIKKGNEVITAVCMFRAKHSGLESFKHGPK